ncbi:MAG: hypothetical protein RL198_712 [Actinomycetota bacterium]
MPIINLGVIPGDGIGPEVTAVALEALRTALGDSAELRVTNYDLGARRYLATGETLTDSDLSSLKAHDALLLGAVGDPRVTPGVLERGLLLRLRFEFQHFVNLRPARLLAGVSSPLAASSDIDFVVVREGTEGPYVGNGGALRTGTLHEVATEVSINTAVGVERVVRYAFEMASSRPRRRLTLVHKTNVLAFAGALWARIFAEVARDYPNVETDYLHIDATTIFMVTDPRRFDVIVTDNLFGDIITDLAAAVTGGIGLAASANLNPTRDFPSMFEPVHGSAPDIAGRGRANPMAAVLSAAMLANHLGYVEAAEALTQAVDAASAAGAASSGSTEAIANEIYESLRHRIAK